MSVSPFSGIALRSRRRWSFLCSGRESVLLCHNFINVVTMSSSFSSKLSEQGGSIREDRIIAALHPCSCVPLLAISPPKDDLLGLGKVPADRTGFEHLDGPVGLDDATCAPVDLDGLVADVDQDSHAVTV